jgi:type IV secretion system protein VirB10
MFVLSGSTVPVMAAPQLDDGPAQAKPTDLAYNNGYQAGFKLGQSDKKAGQKQDFAQASAYRRATDGWKEGVSGELEAYRTNYRAGFADGYKDGLGEPPDRTAAPATPPAEEPRAEPASVPHESVPPPSSEKIPARMAPHDGPPPPAPPPPDGSVSVADGTIVRIRLENTISTRTSRQGDAFTAIVTEPVYLPDSSVVAVPAGAKISGSVTRVLRPGRVKGTAELHLRYDRLTMPGGTDFTMSATTAGLGDAKVGKVDPGEGTINGNTSKGRDGAAIGGSAAGGAVIGAVVGGPPGAAVGAAIGAVVGTGGVLITRGKDVDLPSGTTLQIKLIQPLNVVNPVR